MFDTARIAAAFLVIALAACSRSSSPALPAQPGVDRRPHLAAVAGCAELETAVEDAVVTAMKSELEQARRGGPYPAVAAGDATGAAPASADAGPTSFTTTNTQSVGVDEADFVANDGTRMAVLAGGRLHLVRSWPADALAEAASLEIEGWPRGLFLAGDRVVVLSSVYVPRALEGARPGCPAPAAPVASMSVDAWCGYAASDVTKVTVVDAAALGAPRVGSEVYLPGGYLAARRIGARLRLVLSDALPFPEGVAFWPDLPAGASDAARTSAFDELSGRNEVIIRSRTLDDWLRRGALKRPDGTSIDLGYACTDFAVGSAPTRPGILTLATLDLDAQALASRTSVLARADVVYASAQTLYAAASHWWWRPAPGQDEATYLHAFDLTDPDRAAYLGSGVVDGVVTDPYQLDESAGALRVASTLSRRVEGDAPSGRVERASQISVLRLDQGSLALQGKTDPFGKDERLFATRFLGARGFAVTARQVDPLFTFDLSDPRHPRAVGELQLPGFVAYLHPIDETHLLGVGREPAGQGGPMQVKVQLFDVTDLASPKAGPPTLVGEGWSWSESLWDPKAFTWFAARGLLAIPFADFAPDRLVSDLRLFRVDPATGIAPAGRLPMGDVYPVQSGAGWSFAWSPYVRRSVLADDFVYAVSDAGMRSARVAELPAWLRTLSFAAAAPP